MTAHMTILRRCHTTDRMVAAADRMGIEHVNLALPGFRVRDDTIENVYYKMHC
jgi:hypothetical protein